MRRQRGEYIENPPDCGVELIIQHDVVVNRGCLEQLIARHGKAPFDVALGRISPPPEPAPDLSAATEEPTEGESPEARRDRAEQASGGSGESSGG